MAIENRKIPYVKIGWGNIIGVASTLLILGVALYSGGVMGNCFALLAGAALLMGAINLLTRLQYRSRLNRSLANTTAKILKTYSETTETGPYDADFTRYLVVFEFHSGREQLTLVAGVSETLYKKLHSGDTIMIRFAKEDPRVVLLECEPGWETSGA